MTTAEIASITQDTIEQLAMEYPEQALPGPALHIKRCIVAVAGAMMHEQASQGEDSDLRRAAVR